MGFISVPNVKEIHLGEGCFSWLKIIVENQCKEEQVDITISKNQALQVLYLVYSLFIV